MRSKTCCQRCQTELPEGAPGNRCPSCLLELGLANLLEAEDLPAPVASQRFGDYELIAEIARGGMGVVFKARQMKLNRVVALKLILSGQFATKQEVLRFRGEAEAAANLRHPNIVSIHETGEIGGQHFFSMEYVPGRNLAELVRDGPLPAKRAARYAEVVARAIHYAHQQGTLHRDLKPSNVLIDGDDQLRITDFGLAKKLRGDFGLTVTGQALGSPNFMPPEQTSGRSKDIGPPCDVYGIGAILYHALTGRPPFQAETMEEVLRALHDKEPVSPRLLNASVPRDLETICLKCLEKSPGKRYASAQELADELGRFLRDEPIHSRPIGQAGRFWRWCRRKPLVAGLIAAVAIAVTAGLTGMAWQGRERARALVETRRLLYASDISVGQQAWNSANGEVLRGLLEQHQPKPDEADWRGFEWRLLWGWQRDDDRSVLFPHPGAYAISYSGDGTLIATLSHRLARVWRTAELHPRIPETEFNGADAIAFSPKGHLLAISTEKEGLHFWDAATKRTLGRVEGVTNWVRYIQFSADGSKLATAAPNGTVRLWKMPAGELHHRLKNLSPTRDLAFSPDARYLAVTTKNGPQVWDVEAGQMRWELNEGEAGQYLHCAFSPDSRMLATGGEDTVRLWSVADWKLEVSLTTMNNRSGVVAFAPDGGALVSGGWAGVDWWDLKTRQSNPASRARKNMVNDLAFAPDRQHLAIATDGGVWLENLNPKETFEKIPAREPVKAVLFSPDNRFLAIGTQTGLTLRDMSGGAQSILLSNQPPTYALAFSPDGNVLATGSEDNLVRLWDVPAATNTATLTGHSTWVRGAAFSPNGRWLATSQDKSRDPGPDKDFTVRLWNVSGKRQGDITLPLAGGARTLCFSPDGQHLAVGAQNGEVSLWRVGSWKRTAAHNEHMPRVSGAAMIQSSLFLDGGRTLATADNSGWIVLWDVETHRVLRSWQAHSSGIRSLALSADGHTLASGGYDEELTLWHVPTWRAMLRLKHPAPIFSAAFSSDGTMLATGGDDGMVRLWRAPSLNEIRSASATGQLPAH